MSLEQVVPDLPGIRDMETAVSIIDQLTTENEELLANFDMLKSHVEHLRSENETLSSQNSELIIARENAVSELERRTDTWKRDVEATLDAVTTSPESFRFTDLASFRNSAVEAIHGTPAPADRADDQELARKLESVQAESEARIAALERELAEARSRQPVAPVQRPADDVHALQRRLAEADSVAKRLRAEMDGLRSDLLIRTEERDAARKKVRTLQDSAADVRAALESELSAAKDEVSALRRKLAMASEEHADSRSRIADLRERLNSADNDIREAVAKAVERVEASAAQARARLEHELEVTKSRLSAQTAALEKANAELAGLKARTDAHLHELESMRSRALVAEARGGRMDTDTEVDHLRSKLAATRGEVRRLEDETDRLTSLLRRQRRETEEATEQAAEAERMAQEQVMKAQRQVSAIEEELVALRGMVNDRSQTDAGMKRNELELSQLGMEMGELRNLLEARDAELRMAKEETERYKRAHARAQKTVDRHIMSIQQEIDSQAHMEFS